MRKLYSGLLAVLIGLAAGACESAPAPTAAPVTLPTVLPPRIAEIPPTDTPTPPSLVPADLHRAASLLDRWGLGSGGVAAGVARQPLPGTAAGDYTAATLQNAPVVTP